MKFFTPFTLLFFFPFVFFAQVIKLDSSFNHIGYDSIILGTSPNAGTFILKNTVDNKFFISCTGNPTAILKYNRNGTLDSSFNSVGYLKRTQVQQYIPNMEPIFDEQQRFIFSAFSSNPADDMAFMRVKQNGLTDSSFGVNGILTAPNSSQKKGTLIQFPDKSILALNVIATYIFPEYHYDLRLSKYKKNYTLDSSFGTDGSRLYPFNFLHLTFSNIEFYNNGNFLIGATTRVHPVSSNQGYDYDIKLYRFKRNGDFDTTFGVNGVASPNYGTYLEEGIYSTKLLNDGKILAFGFGALVTNASRIASVNKYLPNGDIDTSFASFGRFFSNNFDEMLGGALQKDNKIICFGTSYGYNILRIRADGFPDLEFGNNSFYKSPFTYVNNQYLGGFPFSNLLENDTTLLVTGDAFEGNQTNNITTAKYKIDFQPFVTGVKTNYCFGTNGSGTIINFPLAGSDTIVTALYDNTALTVSSTGSFSFTNGNIGQHIIIVQFSKGTNIWKETIKLNVQDLPTVNAGVDAGICVGSVTLGTFASPNTFYRWTSSPAGYFSNISNPTVSPTASTIYFLTASNGGCIARDTVIVTVGALLANAGPDKVICLGSGITIGAPAIAGNSYSWVSIPAGFTSTFANPGVSPAVTTNYIVTLSSGTCVAKDTVVVTVMTAPLANAGPDKNICPGGSNNNVTIGTTAIAGNNYSWSPSTGLNSTTISQPIATPNTSTTFKVTVTNAGGCKSTDDMVVNVTPGFTITLPVNLIKICVAGNTNIGVVSQAGFTYNWTSLPPGFSSTLSNPNVSPVVNTIFILTQTNTTTGCFATASVNVVIDSTCHDRPSIFPNPANNYIVIQLDANNNETKSFELINANGNSVLKKELNSTTTFDIRNVAGGIYFYTIRNLSNGELLISGKLIVQR